MRTRTLSTATAEALRTRIKQDGLIRTSVALSVSPTTLDRALRGWLLRLSTCDRLEQNQMMDPKEFFADKSLFTSEPSDAQPRGVEKGPLEDEIRAECEALAVMLVEKNRAYGNSALDPVRVFSKVDAVEQIRVRLDDKLSRLSRGQAAGEDVEKDLLGYLILLRIARKRASR